MRKKTAILFLLTLFVLNSVGIHLLFHLQQNQARATAAKSKEPQVTLVIPLAETKNNSRTFLRIHDHEIVYNGHRYDIDSETIAGGNLVLKGHRDDKEDKAFRILRQHQDNADQSPVKSKPVPKVPLYDLPPQTEALAADTQIKKEQFIIPFTPLLSPFFAVADPPPEFS